MHDTPISIGSNLTLTDVGTSYDAVQISRGIGIALANFIGVESIDFRVGMNRNGGAGTISWQLWNQTDTSELGVIDDTAGAGDKFVTTTINGGAIPSGIKLLRIRCKSTTAGDDPIFGGAALLLKRPAMTFERLGLASQLTHNAYGMTRDMRDNANGYKARVIAGHPIGTIAAVMVADAGQYLNRLAWFTTAIANNLAAVTATLADHSVPIASLTAFRDNLITVAEHTQGATLTTGAQINTEADFILANVPSYARLW